MKAKQILDKLDECMELLDLIGFENCLEDFFEQTGDEDACRAIAVKFLNKYTITNADSIAAMMGTVIQIKPELALVNFPANDFFQISLLAGSPELYECYVDAGLAALINENTENEMVKLYKKMVEFASQINVDEFKKHRKCIREEDYSGAFETDDIDDNVMLINREDYQVLEDVVDKYNAIIGRREIMEDLMLKAGLIQG